MWNKVRVGLVVVLVATALAFWFQDQWSDPARKNEPVHVFEAAQVEPSTSDIEDKGFGLWRKSNREHSARELTPEQQQQIDELQAIGYLDGTEPARDQLLIPVYDREQTEPGLNFFVSGHAAEATLMDPEGRVLHRWAHPFKAIWPDRAIPKRKAYWRRAHLFENGDIIAIYEGWGIVKLNARSEILWANPVRAHHDLEVMPDGQIYVLTRESHMVPEINRSKPVLEDFISILDADGQLVRSVSVLDAIMNSPFRGLYESKARRDSGDIFHTNSLFVLDGRGSDRAPWLAAGNILVSMRDPSLVAVIDLATGEAVAMWDGPFRFQHDPKILDNGNLLLFDNGDHNMASTVRETDPVTHEAKWSFGGSRDRPFFSKFCGAAQRLPNGNTLITESGEGRAFEVTPDKKIVWEYNSPHRAGAEGEFVASLLEVIRLRADFPVDWASAPTREPSPATKEP